MAHKVQVIIPFRSDMLVDANGEQYDSAALIECVRNAALPIPVVCGGKKPIGKLVRLIHEAGSGLSGLVEFERDFDWRVESLAPVVQQALWSVSADTVVAAEVSDARRERSGNSG